MNRRSASSGLVIKHKKPDEIKPKEVIELLEKKQNEEVVEIYAERVLEENKPEENKPEDRLENIKKETIEKLIKQQMIQKPKNKKKKVVYVSESEDETEE